MIRVLWRFAMTAAAAVLLSGPATAQEKKDASPPAGQEMILPKPGPEHEILRKEAGVWDAEIEMTDPAGKTEVAKGVETNTLLGDGLWVIQDFKGQLMGAPFQGHGVTGYDPVKKKYVGTWVDSMSSTLSPTEGTYDAKTRTSTSWMEGMGPDGKVSKMRMTVEWKDDNRRVFTMHSPDGAPTLKIRYKRRAAAAAPRTAK